MSEITQAQERFLLADELDEMAGRGDLKPNYLRIAAQKLREVSGARGFKLQIPDVAIISSNEFNKFTEQLKGAVTSGYRPIGPTQALFIPGNPPGLAILYTITLILTEIPHETQPT